MRVHHAATRDPDEAERWRQAFCHSQPDAVALVACATGPLATGETAKTTRVDDAMWGRLTAEAAECSWRAEGDRVALSIIAEHPVDGLELDVSDVDDEPHRRAAQLEGPVRETMGGVTQLTEVIYCHHGIAWLRRTELS